MAEFIVNPAEATTPIEVVCGNANAEIIRFTFERNSDGVDLADCAWAVTAKNSGGFSDTYMEGHGITNVSVSDTTISVDWALFGIAVGATGRTKYQLIGLQGKAIVKQFPYHTLNVLSYLESTLSTEAQEDVSALWETIEYVGNQLPEILEAEAARKVAESGRVSAENARGSAEKSRVAAEQTRTSNENTRKNNEQARVQAETLRKANETARDNAEALRKNAEAARTSAEKNRAEAEDSRAEAENKRAADFAKFDLTATRNGKVTTVIATNAQGKITVGEVMDGKDGKDGTGLIIKGLYATLDELKAAHPSASAGDAYSVGTSDSNEVYIWDTDTKEWQNLGPLQGPAGEDAPQEAVLFVEQTLSTNQKAQARTNLGLAAVASSGSYNDLSDKPTIPTVPSTFAASKVTAGTLAGKVQANATAMATITNPQVRDIVGTTTDPGAGTASSYPNGTVVLVYE